MGNPSLPLLSPALQWEGQWSEVLLTSLYNITAQQAERQAYQVRLFPAALQWLAPYRISPLAHAAKLGIATTCPATRPSPLHLRRS